ncbi:hypothetical protein NQ317_013217, partial [Molorchus minor]
IFIRAGPGIFDIYIMTDQGPGVTDVSLPDSVFFSNSLPAIKNKPSSTLTTGNVGVNIVKMLGINKW